MPKTSTLGLRRGTSGTYRLRLPADLQAQWTAHMQAHPDAAEELRAWMRERVGSPSPARPPLVPATPPRTLGRRLRAEETAPKRRIELRLTPSEVAALAQLADERECSIQWWVTSLVRAALTRGITVGGAELKALADSNYQLMLAVRTLGKIMERLRTEPEHAPTVEYIQTLTQELRVHRKRVSALIYASSARWELQP